MTITTFEHRGRRWKVVVHPAPDLTSDCGLELIFVAEGPSEEKYAWPIKQATLDRLTGTHLDLDDEHLRHLLDQAVELGRVPAFPPSEREG